MGDDMPERRRSTDWPEHLHAILMPKVVAIGTAVLLAGALVVAGLALVQTSSNTDQTCAAALRVRNAVVAVFVDAQARSERTPAQTATERERKEAAEFFDQSIRTLRAAECQG